MNNRRIHRLLAILQTLQNGGRHDLQSLMAASGVSRRTVFRDLQTLRSVGLPVEYDAKNGQYWLPSSPTMTATNFTAAEALALMVVAREFAGDAKSQLHAAARYAADKIEASLPTALRRELVDASQGIALRTGTVRDAGTPADVYDTLVAARQNRQVLELRYRSLTEWEEIATRLKPYQLMFCRHSWYVIGHSSLHKAIRTFKLQRVLSAETTERKFRVPKSFRLSDYLGNAWTMVPEPGPDLRVRILFSPFVAHNVAEVVWHPTQQLKWLDDGRLEYRATVSGAAEISWWILGYGDQAEVIGPARLKKLVTQRVRSMCRIYSDAPT